MNFVVTRPEPVVYMTMRADLDYFLLCEAEKAGTKVIQSCAIKALNARDDAMEIISERQNFRAKFVVAADGVHSLAAKAAGWPELPVLVPALEHEIYLADSEFARFSQMPRFDFDAIDGGYAWVFPKRTHLSVGILSMRRVCPDLQAKLAGYLQSLGITRVEKVERHGYLIPLAPRPAPLARGRVLLAGDAAGLADPVTAEGITHAIMSGQLAAAALTEGRLEPAQVGAIYQSLLQKHILGELRAARFLAHVLYRHPRLRHGVFRLRGQKLCEYVANVIMGQSSFRGALKRPLSYLKLLGL
jgi:flavin-dependent dehydrogenase